MLHRKALVLILGLWSTFAIAQVPVVEAGRGGQPAAAQPQPQGNELMLTLYTQMEALQQEVQLLRGMVEEQANQLRRLQTENRDRYLDVDRRLSELSGGAAIGLVPGASPGVPEPATQAGALAGTNTLPADPAVAVQPPAANPQVAPGAVSLGNAPPAPVATAPSTTAGAAVTPAPASATPAPAAGAELGEQDLYRTALNLLLEQSQYDESIRLFQGYIDRFPQGRLLTNAYYWQGEAFILVGRYDEARNVFMRLINDYPQDPKAAGAMLKLGVVYQQMGDRARAEQTWQEIATRYPENVTEIRAAQDYLGRR